MPIYIVPQENHRSLTFLPDADNKFFQQLVVDDPVKFAQEKHQQGYLVIALYHTVPDLQGPASWADYNIGRTMWEMDNVPSYWAQKCNTMDELWVRRVGWMERRRVIGVVC